MIKPGTHTPERLQLAIAEIGFEVTWEGGVLAQEASWNRYEGFLAKGPHHPPHVRLHVCCGELPPVQADELVFDAVPNHWRLFRANGHYVFEVFDTLPPHPTVQLAVMRPDFSAGEVYCRPERTHPRPAWSPTRLMSPLGELLLIHQLSHGRGVLLHALGVSDQGEGLLFIGPSGAGKTTLADLYKPHQGVTILNDERVVVTRRAGQWWLSGTPWPGMGFTVSADSVPLRKVFFLEHGPCNALIADSVMKFEIMFVQQLFLPFWNADALAFALRFGEELLRALPVHRLAFVNDARAIEFLRKEA